MPHGKGAPGRLQLYVDGDLVGDAEAAVTTPFVLNPGALTCGANPGSPVTPDYTGAVPFTGTIHTVTVDVSGELIDDAEAELRVAPGPAVGGLTHASVLRGRLCENVRAFSWACRL